MARYISAEKAKEILLKNFPECRNCAEEIDCVPTEDVEPVVHAHWRIDGSCSKCGEHLFASWGTKKNFCTHCGARMDEVTVNG